MTGAGTSENDRSYKRLFSHPTAVEELLRGFLHESWLEGLDFTTLERVSGSSVTDDLRERHNDLIWRLDCGTFPLYVLLEFQSTPHSFMAVRLLGYVSLLFEGVIRAEKLKRGDRLPAVLPLVLYTGSRPWRAPEDLGSLYRPLPPDLRRRLPDLSYVLIDQNRLDLSRPELADNRVAVLFGIEKCRDPFELRGLIDRLIHLLPKAETDLRQTFTIWIRSALRRTFPGDIISSSVDLEENPMLEENMRAWLRGVKREEKVKALRDVLLSQMTLRFGRLPLSVRRRVGEIASAQELHELARRLITAESLQEMQLG